MKTVLRNAIAASLTAGAFVVVHVLDSLSMLPDIAFLLLVFVAFVWANWTACPRIRPRWLRVSSRAALALGIAFVVLTCCSRVSDFVGADIRIPKDSVKYRMFIADTLVAELPVPSNATNIAYSYSPHRRKQAYPRTGGTGVHFETDAAGASAFTNGLQAILARYGFVRIPNSPFRHTDDNPSETDIQFQKTHGVDLALNYPKARTYRNASHVLEMLHWSRHGHSFEIDVSEPTWGDERPVPTR